MRPPSRIVASVVATGFVLLSLSRLAGAEINSGGKHCLWRITNARAPFYLLGSVHSLQRSDYDTVPAIEQAIRQSQKIMFEVDPKEDVVFATKLRAAARLPRGEQIKGKLSPKTYNYLRKITINGMAEWQHLYPWAIAMLLNYPQLQGVSSIYGVDTHIAQSARRYSKATGGLETADEHVRVFSDMQMIEGEVYLLQALVHARRRSTAVSTRCRSMEIWRYKPALRDTRKRNERSPNSVVAVARPAQCKLGSKT